MGGGGGRNQETWVEVIERGICQSVPSLPTLMLMGGGGGGGGQWKWGSREGGKRPQLVLFLSCTCSSQLLPSQ